MPDQGLPCRRIKCGNSGGLPARLDCDGRFLCDRFHNYFVSRDNPQGALALEKYTLMVALRDYRKEHGAYPILGDTQIGDVKKQLIGGGYLPPAPDADQTARYVSLDGKSYGLLFHINRSPTNRLGRRCLIEVDAVGTGWWANPPKCRF